jgi:hypothetical protein
MPFRRIFQPLIVLGAVAWLSACASDADVQASYVTRDTEACTDKGLIPKTDAFRECLAKQAHLRDQIPISAQQRGFRDHGWTHHQ